MGSRGDGSGSGVVAGRGYLVDSRVLPRVRVRRCGRGRAADARVHISDSTWCVIRERDPGPNV
eukprot:4584996-Prymnesium_polylepis.1